MRFCLMMKMQQFCFRTFLVIHFDTLFLPECVKRVSMSKWYKILWDIKIFQLQWISTLMLPKKWRNKNLKALITTWRKQYKLDDMKQAGRICCLLVSYYLPYSKIRPYATYATYAKTYAKWNNRNTRNGLSSTEIVSLWLLTDVGFMVE